MLGFVRLCVTASGKEIDARCAFGLAKSSLESLDDDDASEMPLD